MASTLIAKYAAHQRVIGFSRRTIERRTWSLSLWHSHCAHRGERVDTASPDLLEEFLARWPSAQSRYSIRSDIHQFYGWAIDRGHLSCADPTRDVPPARVPQRAATPVAASDVMRLIDSCPRPIDRRMVMLAAYAGLRISEIAALRGEDIDIDGRQLVVRCGKGGGDDVVPLAVELAVELARAPRAGRVVPMTGPSVGDRIRTLMRRAGIAGRPHDLRHSFGTQAARRTSGNLVLVAKLMRHRRITTTTRYVRWHTTGHEVVDGLYGDAA